MKNFKIYLTEMWTPEQLKKATKFSNWVMPTKEEVKKFNFEIVSKAPVVKLPNSYYKELLKASDIFQPFTMDDILNKTDYKLDYKEKKIVDAYINNRPVPYLILIKQYGDYYILDGFRRLALAVPLGVTVKCKLI